MEKSKFTEEQIAFALRQAESGAIVAEVCRKMAALLLQAATESFKTTNLRILPGAQR